MAPVIHTGIQRLAMIDTCVQVLRLATLPSLEEIELWLSSGSFVHVGDNSFADFAIRSACSLKKVLLHGRMRTDWLIAFLASVPSLEHLVYDTSGSSIDSNFLYRFSENEDLLPNLTSFSYIVREDDFPWYCLPPIAGKGESSLTVRARPLEIIKIMFKEGCVLAALGELTWDIAMENSYFMDIRDTVALGVDLYIYDGSEEISESFFAKVNDLYDAEMF